MLVSKSLGLVGLPGVGKTSLGQKLADVLEWHFIDIDHQVEIYLGEKIMDYVAHLGIQAFRQIEYEIICRMLDQTNGNVVMAFGGGVLTHAPSFKLLHESPLSFIYIQANVETILKYSDLTDRPLFHQVPSVRHQLELLLQARQSTYQAIADYHLVRNEQDSLEDLLIKTLAML